MKKVPLLKDEGNLYKANLHCHTTVSDGKFTPEEIKKMYLDRGYSAVAYTDHRKCVPHTELTDENFVALTGIEIAFGMKKATSVHISGVMRNPITSFDFADNPMDDTDKINEGIKKLKEYDAITTLNHPRWSGMSYEALTKIEGFNNVEVVNGYEQMQDGYSSSDAIYELELRRGKMIRPIAADDSHTSLGDGIPGYEYFKGFTVIKAKELTYESLTSALDGGNFYASTGPMFKNLWVEDGVLNVECTPVSAVYVHGALYSHRVAFIRGEDVIEKAEIKLPDNFSCSDYFFVQIVSKNGKRAWSIPYSTKEIL